jgi:aconitate hydratase
MLAKKAAKLGLRVKPYIKTSLSPGSGLVTDYLSQSRMLPFLEKLGFRVIGYGCNTCVNNTNPLSASIVEAIESNNLVSVSVFSGNRNFETRIHPSSRGNYLASAPLVVAYAIAGRIDIDFEHEPLGICDETGKPVFLKDIWPTRTEIQKMEITYVIPSIFNKTYNKNSVIFY